MKNQIIIALIALLAISFSATSVSAQKQKQQSNEVVLPNEIVYTLEKNSEIIKHWNSGGYYSSGKYIYNAKNKRMCKVDGKILDFEMRPSAKGGSYAVLYQKKGVNKLYIGNMWKTKKRITTLKAVPNPTAICYSDLGNAMLVAGSDKRVYVYNPENYILRNRFDIDFKATQICMSPDTKKIALVSDRGITIYDTESKKFSEPISVKYDVLKMMFTYDSGKLTVLSSDQKLMCYDVANLSAVEEIAALGDALDFTIAPHSDYAAVVTSDSRIATIDLNNPYEGREYYNVCPGIKSIDILSENEKRSYLAYSTTNKLHYYPFEFGATEDGEKSVGAFQIPGLTSYREFYVGEQLTSWYKPGKYESTAEYSSRVNDRTIVTKGDELRTAARELYLEEFTKEKYLDNMELMPYDEAAKRYTIATNYGDIHLSNFGSKEEIDAFSKEWAGVELRDAEFIIQNDVVVISKLTMVTPKGQSYSYQRENVVADVEVDFQPDNNYYAGLIASYEAHQANVEREELLAKQAEIQAKLSGNALPEAKSVDAPQFAMPQLTMPSLSNGLLASATTTTATTPAAEAETFISDIDVNIPRTNFVNSTTRVVIIANKDYIETSSVANALNDGRAFKNYCHLTLGIPEGNINFIENATATQMSRAISKVVEARKTRHKEEMNLIFYYAGHGIPNEETKDAYLIPTDASADDTRFCYSINDLYNTLGNANFDNVFVFMDACFSGGTPDGGMLIAARSVVMDYNEAVPVGNMVVFTAASDKQMAFAYDEKNHGMFTYFLLKKLQETGGNVSLGELYEYVHYEVECNTFDNKGKIQSPQVLTSYPMDKTWKDYKFVNIDSDANSNEATL